MSPGGTADGQWMPVMGEPVTGRPYVDAPAGGAYPAPMSTVGTDSGVYVTFTPLATPQSVFRNRHHRRAHSQRSPANCRVVQRNIGQLRLVRDRLGLGTKLGSPTLDAIMVTIDGGRTWHE